MEISSTIKFRVICEMLKEIKNTDSRIQKQTIIDQYCKSFLKHRLKFCRQFGNCRDNSVFCVLRCLIPSCDRSRPAYGLQIPTLGKVYQKILQIPIQSREADILLGRRYNPVQGDYAEKVYRLLKPRCSSQVSRYSLEDIHRYLDVISEGNRHDTEKIITEISERMSALEQMWFIRLLLKSMSLGISDKAILNVFHPLAADFLKSCQNLRLLCERLANNRLELETPTTTEMKPLQRIHQPLPAILFQPIQPQLCEIFPGQLEKLMAEHVLYLETKMDGERFHLHYDANGEQFKYFSRRGVDYTASFESFSARLQPLIARIGNLESFILDGEMMIWDERRQCFHEKSENTDVKTLHKQSHHRHSNGGDWRPCFVVYDLLYLNGISLLHLSYVQRRSKLHNLLREQRGLLHVMESVKITSSQQFQELFQKALNAQEEGVVLKSQMSCYQPGKRNGGGWFKLKADYLNGLINDFDLLIMGGFYNRTRTFIESFLMGVLQYNSSADNFEVWSVAKVSNVLPQREALTKLLSTGWHLVTEEVPPMWFHYVHQVAEGRPDVWIEPKDSVILQIKATDLHPSQSFALPSALHFPRIVSWRRDKPWQDCLSLQEFHTIERNSRGHGVQKIVRRPVDLEDLLQPRSRKPKPLSRAQKRKLALKCYERNVVDESQVKISSNVLKGFMICVLSGSRERHLSVYDIKILILENGGRVVENPLPNHDNCILVAGDDHYRVRIFSKSNKYNVVRLDWLLDSCQQRRKDLRPSDLLAMTSTLRQQFQDYYEQLSETED